MGSILIFGVSGFTGKYFLQYIERNGLQERFDFYGVDRFVPGGASVLRNRFQGDITDPGFVRDCVAKANPDYIINLVGMFGNKTLDEFLRVNVSGSKNILDACVLEGMPVRKILLIGSAAEYGVECENPISENALPRPVNDHGFSKLLQTCLASYYFQTFRLPVVTARTFNILGEGASEELSIGRFEKELADTPEGGTILTGDLSNKRDYMNAEDVVDAYWTLLMHGQSGEVYNVCSGKSIRIGDLLSEMIRRSGKTVSVQRDPNFVKKGDLSDIYGNNKKLANILC